MTELQEKGSKNLTILKSNTKMKGKSDYLLINNHKSEEMNREDWIDSLKGIMIICVVIGHTCTNQLCEQSNTVATIYLFINSLHMPIFFIMAGYLYYRKNEKYEKNIQLYIMGRFNRLIKPYIIYTVALYAIIYAMIRIPFAAKILSKTSFDSNNINIMTMAKDIFFCRGYVAKHMWFIYVLFIVSVVAIFIEKMKISKSLIAIICFMTLLSLVAYGVSMDLIIMKILFYMIFYLAGSMCIIQFKNTWSFVCLLGVIFIEFIYLIFYASFLSDVPLLVCSIKLVLGFLTLPGYMYLGTIFANNKFIKTIGQKSFDIYLYHQPFITTGVVTVFILVGVSPMIVILVCPIIAICTSLLISRFVYYSAGIIWRVLWH